MVQEKGSTMLQGTLVFLRAVRRDDLERLCAFNNDVAVELAGGGDPPLPQSLERLQAEFDSQVGGGGRNGSSFVIEADGQCIGQCALFSFDHAAQTAELGIAIGDQAYWGKGFGREAIQLLIAYGFRHHNLHKVHLRVHARNARAIGAYAACGFVEEGRLRQHVWSDGSYDDLVCMGVLAAEAKF
jgi:RimJ/RimL family protein N-acetyltransferase